MTSQDGIWLVEYQGKFGQGIAIIVLVGGNITGAGSRGGLWDGTYKFNEASGNLDMTLTIRFASGVASTVMKLIGKAATSETYNFSVPANVEEHRLPPLQTLLGPISAVMRKLRDLP